MAKDQIIHKWVFNDEKSIKSLCGMTKYLDPDSEIELEEEVDDWNESWNNMPKYGHGVHRQWGSYYCCKKCLKKEGRGKNNDEKK